MRAVRPARAQQSLPDDSVPDCSVSYAPLLSTRFLAGTGRLVMVRGLLTEGLPFLGKVLQCACQGDAKRCVPHTYFLPGPAHSGPPNHACASPVTLQNSFKWI